MPMTNEETVILLRTIRAACPQQHLDEYTPDAWHELLGDLELLECMSAVKEIAKRQPFVAPAEIRAEVRRVREERLARAPVPAPSADATDEPGRYQEMVRAAVRRIADGRDIRRALGSVPLPSEPSEEYEEMREALVRRDAGEADKRTKALQQAAEYRAIAESLGGAEHQPGGGAA